MGEGNYQHEPNAKIKWQTEKRKENSGDCSQDLRKVFEPMSHTIGDPPSSARSVGFPGADHG